MSKPAYFQILETSSKEEALKLITFSIERVPLYYRLNGEENKITQQVIVREDTNCPFFVISPSYKVVKHEDAFSSVFDGLKRMGLPFELKSVGIDRGGAKMIARFQILKDYEVTEGDTIRPEIVLVNSYDGCLGLGFDLGSFRKVGLTPSKAFDYKIKWFNSKKKNDINKMYSALKNAIKIFERKVVPHYQEMANKKATHKQMIDAIIYAAQKDILPIKAAKIAIKNALLEKEREWTLWDIFGVFNNIVTHIVKDVSPTRTRELYYCVSSFFKDESPLLVIVSDLDHKEWTGKKDEIQILNVCG